MSSPEEEFSACFVWSIISLPFPLCFHHHAEPIRPLRIFEYSQTVNYLHFGTGGQGGQGSAFAL